MESGINRHTAVFFCQAYQKWCSCSTIQESQLLRTSGAPAAAAAFVIRAVALLAHTVEPVRDP